MEVGSNIRTPVPTTDRIGGDIRVTFEVRLTGQDPSRYILIRLLTNRTSFLFFSTLLRFLSFSLPPFFFIFSYYNYPQSFIHGRIKLLTILFKGSGDYYTKEKYHYSDRRTGTNTNV